MTSALLGLAVIVLIALVSVGLGELARLLASWVPAEPGERRDLTLADRLEPGDETIARDLRPDDLHPVVRAAAQDTGDDVIHELMYRPELAVRSPRSTPRALRRPSAPASISRPVGRSAGRAAGEPSLPGSRPAVRASR